MAYYSYFGTAVNQFLIKRGVFDIHSGEVVGFVVDSGCSYFSSISFPDLIRMRRASIWVTQGLRQ